MYNVVNYNKLSFVVTGTDQDDEELKNLGGRWNPNLVGGPGWIFNKRRHLENVREYIVNDDRRRCYRLIYSTLLFCTTGIMVYLCSV